MCDCECHDPGRGVLHYLPCCDRCYEKRSKRQQRKLDEQRDLARIARREAALAWLDSFDDLIPPCPGCGRVMLAGRCCSKG